MEEFVGVTLVNDEAGVDGFPECLVHGLFGVCLEPRLSVPISAMLPRQARCLRASCVVIDNRFSFRTMRSTTLSV